MALNVRGVPVAVAAAMLAGVGIAAQALINGRLATSLGSAPVAGVVSGTLNAVLLVIVATGTGATREALRRVRAGFRPRGWHIAASSIAALPLFVTAFVAPRLGVALLVVGLVTGQTATSLLIDHLGLGPGGRRGLSRNRIAGAALAVLAVGLGAAQQNALHVSALLALAVIAGASMATQQAVLGHLSAGVGSALAGSMLLAIAAMVLAIPFAIATVGGIRPPHGWGAPAVDWLGGVIGAGGLLMMATTVATLGVFRLSLALVAGQALGGLLLDATVPQASHALSVQSVVGVALTIAAVAIGARRNTVGAGVAAQPANR